MNLIAFLIILGGLIISTILVVYGAWSLIRYRKYLDHRVKVGFGLSPVLALGIISVFPGHPALLAFPFGLFAGLPFLLIFDSQSWSVYYLLALAGTLANLCGAVGLIRFVSRRFGYR